MRDNKEVTLKAELKNRQGNTEVISAEATSVDVLGAKFKELNSKTKNSLGLSYGLEVASVSKGKFQQAGIRPGFIVVKINNQAVRSEDDVKSALDAAVNTNDQFKVLTVAGVYPNGKVAYYTINLAD